MSTRADVTRPAIGIWTKQSIWAKQTGNVVLRLRRRLSGAFESWLRHRAADDLYGELCRLSDRDLQPLGLRRADIYRHVREMEER
jgi:uncharacterized protein YjiS (DUF1127 family)